MSAVVGATGSYFRAVERADVHGATDLVVALLDDGTPMDTITTAVLAPAQARVGALWESGRWSIADEFVATSITEGALTALTHAASARPEPQARHVVVACAEGEWHSLPARMAAAIAGTNGQVRVTTLGASTSPGQLHRRLSAGDVDVVALSCTIPTNLIGAARCIAAAHDLAVPVVAGGRAFGRAPHRARAIGADGWAADAAALRGPLPRLTGLSSRIPDEVLLLDAVDAATLSLAGDRVLDAFRHPPGAGSCHETRIREDLECMARYTAAALLTEDASIVEDLLAWLCERRDATVPTPVIITSAYLLAESLEPQAPSGAIILGDAAARLERQELRGTGKDLSRSE